MVWLPKGPHASPSRRLPRHERKRAAFSVQGIGQFGGWGQYYARPVGAVRPAISRSGPSAKVMNSTSSPQTDLALTGPKSRRHPCLVQPSAMNEYWSWTCARRSKPSSSAAVASRRFGRQFSFGRIRLEENGRQQRLLEVQRRRRWIRCATIRNAKHLPDASWESGGVNWPARPRSGVQMVCHRHVWKLGGFAARAFNGGFNRLSAGALGVFRHRPALRRRLFRAEAGNLRLRGRRPRQHVPARASLSGGSLRRAQTRSTFSP